MNLQETVMGREIISLGISALKSYLKKPYAVTIKKSAVEGFLNDKANGSFVSSIDLEDDWVILILK